ncbi:hypothetical protein ASZ90_006976 [hydrocarbon metagenome]|uniref:PABS domain-containing protein n=1 Tax=hydrocarbon metagenome TaxID=938273 RepID=A0A0W8FQN8_9ZZZZ
MNLSLVAIGLVSILGQVVLLRELNVSFYGVELIYLLALGIWLFWTAVGAVIGRRIQSPSLNNIAILFILLGIAIPLDIAFIRYSRLLFSATPGAYLTFLQQLTVAVICILPAGLLSGLLFQWTAKIYIGEDRTLAVAYAIESMGGLIGGLFSTLFIMWGIRNCSVAIFCAVISIITSVIILKGLKKSPLRWIAITMICVSLALFWNVSSLDHWMTRWNHPNFLESKDSPYGRITVTKLYNQVSVWENDALAFETEGTDAEYFCHLTALQHQKPQDVLILGGGIEGIVSEIVKYKPRRIDYVELNPVMLNMAKKYLPDEIKKSLVEPNVHIIFADPRQYLEKSYTYDLILVGMPEPTSGQANRFYTREFFEQCSAKLNPGGILGFRLRTAENFWTKPLTSRNASIYSALQSVFPEVLFLPGTINIVTASQTTLPDSPETMSHRLQDMKITTRLISSNYIHYLFTNDRFFKTRDLLKKENALPNTDIRPVCYQYAFIIWLSKFFPRLALLDLSSIMDKKFFKQSLLLLCIILPVIFLLSRSRPAPRRALLVATAGFIGMVLETILILYYQAKHGVLYQDIGLLLMSFMAGLASGALTVNKAMLRQVKNQKTLRLYGAALLIGFCILCIFTEMKIIKSTSSGLIMISFLMATTGFLVAGIFTHASLYEVGDQKIIVSPLYSADLIGGFIGSLLGSLILIPLAGMSVTALIILLFAVLSLTLI